MNDKKDNQGIDNLLNELKSLTEKNPDKITGVQKDRRNKTSDSDIKDLLIKAFGETEKGKGDTASEYDVDSSDFTIVDEKHPPDIEEMPNPEKHIEIQAQPEIWEVPEIQKEPETVEIPDTKEIPDIETEPEIDTSPETKDPDEQHIEEQTEVEKIPQYDGDSTVIQTPPIEIGTEEGNTPGANESPIESGQPFDGGDGALDEWIIINKESQADKEDEPIALEIPKAKDEVTECSFEEPSLDTDINMAIALGYSTELRDSVGDTRIKEACTKIAWDNSSAGGDVNLKSDNMAFGYRNREFTDICQEKQIKENFEEDKKKLRKRIAITGSLMLLIMLYENSAIFGINLPSFIDPIENPVVHMLFALQLIVLCAVPSYKQIYSGILNAVLFTPTFLSISAVSMAVSVLYNIISVFTYKSGVPIMFNFSAAFCLFLSCICEYLNYKREFESFSFITENHKAENLFAPLFRHDTECKNLASHKFTYDVCKVSFISKYFYRTNKKSKNCISFNFFWIALIVIGMILAVLTIAITQNAALAMCAIAMPFAFGLPVIMLVCSSYPLYIAVCKLLNKKATIIGEQSVYQHSEQSTYSFDDLNAFPAENIPSQKIRLYNNSKMYEVLYNIKSLFYTIDSPLVGIVDSSILEFEDVSKDDIQLKKITDNGVQAIIKTDTHILAGNYEFISEYIKDFSPSEKDKAIIDEGRISVMYIALGGELAAKIYVTYDINKGFLKSVKALENMGHRTGIMTTDPNINDKLMRKICPDIKQPITVNKPKETKTADRANCGIVVNGKATDVIYPLNLCLKIKKIRDYALRIQIIATSVTILLLTACALFSKLPWLSSLLAVGFQIVLATAAFIIVRIKLKR